MDDDRHAEFAALVAAARQDAAGRARARDDDLRALQAARADPADDEHDPEGATLSAEWSRLEGLRLEAVRELGELDAATARLADGSYGICVVCGQPIAPDRLRVRPAATMCIACAGRLG